MVHVDLIWKDGCEKTVTQCPLPTPEYGENHRTMWMTATSVWWIFQDSRKQKINVTSYIQIFHHQLLQFHTLKNSLSQDHLLKFESKNFYFEKFCIGHTDEEEKQPHFPNYIAGIGWIRDLGLTKSNAELLFIKIEGMEPSGQQLQATYCC